MSLRTTFLWTMVAALAIAAGLGIIAILFDGLGRTGERVLVSSLIVGAFSLTCLAAAFVLESRRIAIAMWVGIGASLAALLLWLVVVWASPLWSERAFVRIAMTFTIAAVWAAHVGLLCVLRIERDGWRWARRVTVALATMLAVMVACVVWIDLRSDFAEKSLAVLSVLTACGTVVTPILALIDRVGITGPPESIGARLQVALRCPRCGSDESLPVGRSRCSGCGLRIGLDVREPRCACGYLLYQLEGDACPECGRAVSAVDRWTQ